MSNIKELREKLRIIEKKLERNWTEERHKEFLELTSQIVKLEGKQMQFTEEFKKEMQKKVECADRWRKGKKILRGVVVEALEEIRKFKGITPLEDINDVLEDLSEYDVLYDVELMSRYMNLYKLALYIQVEDEEPIEVGYVYYTMKPHSEEVKVENVVIWEDEEEGEEE